MTSKPVIKQDGGDNRAKHGTTSALLTRQDDGKCAYCLSMKAHIDSKVHKLWDLETLGIRETGSGDEQHEEFKDSISFDGIRYSVKLPWKEGHPYFPSNYATKFRLLKGQVSRFQGDRVFLENIGRLLRTSWKLRLC